MKSPEQNDGSQGLFHGLEEAALSAFLTNLKHVSYKKGEQIAVRADGGGCLHLILKGEVSLSASPEGSSLPETAPAVLGAGEYFGELTLFGDESHPPRAVAKTDAELMEIPQSEFLKISVSHPVVMFNVIRKLNEQLKYANSRFGDLTDRMIDKSRLMAIGITASKIIHDIKTPLTVISLTAQLIENLFPDSAEYTDSILKQVKLVDELIREVMDYVKGSPTSLFINKVDLDAFLDDIKSTYGPSLKGRDIDLVTENKCGGPVYFDEERMRRVVINLLRNSSEAIEKQGTIKISTQLASNWLQISVIDNGPGIPENIASSLFRPFVTYGKPNGTGLGLAICSKLVQDHSGRLEYKPVEPNGSRFDIRIPQNPD